RGLILITCTNMYVCVFSSYCAFMYYTGFRSAAYFTKIRVNAYHVNSCVEFEFLDNKNQLRKNELVQEGHWWLRKISRILLAGNWRTSSSQESDNTAKANSFETIL